VEQNGNRVLAKKNHSETINKEKELSSPITHFHHVLTHEQKKITLTTIPFDNDATIGNKKRRKGKNYITLAEYKNKTN